HFATGTGVSEPRRDTDLVLQRCIVRIVGRRSEQLAQIVHGHCLLHLARRTLGLTPGKLPRDARNATLQLANSSLTGVAAHDTRQYFRIPRDVLCVEAVRLD